VAVCVDCESEFNQRRFDLGYNTCLDCGSPPVKVIMIEVNKSNPTITLDSSQLVGKAYANCEISSELKTRNYVQLRSYNNPNLYTKK
jgi:hypothetical protein